VVVARKPEVFVRALTMEEGRKPQRIARSAIRSLMQAGDDYVRQAVHTFNERGFDALDPKWSGRLGKRHGPMRREAAIGLGSWTRSN